MGQLSQAAAISIVGGADGVTSIYVVDRGMIFAPLVLLAAAIFLLVIGIRKRRKALAVGSAVFAALLVAGLSLVALRNLAASRRAAEIAGFAAPENAPAAAEPSVPWTRGDVVGLSLELVSDGGGETFRFSCGADGSDCVSCAFFRDGSASESDLLWLIDADGNLLVYDHTFDVEGIKIEKISVDGDILFARRNGEPVRYKISGGIVDEKSYPFGDGDLWGLDGKLVSVGDGAEETRYVFCSRVVPPSKKAVMSVGTLIVRSGLPDLVAGGGQCVFDGDSLKISGDESFVLSGGRLRFFRRGEELRVFSVSEVLKANFIFESAE